MKGLIMATDAEAIALVERYGPWIREATIPCETTQANFPHPKNQPWAKDGRCTICGAEVETTRVAPDGPSTYSHIVARPHTRTQRWFSVDADELHDLIEYQNEW